MTNAIVTSQNQPQPNSHINIYKLFQIVRATKWLETTRKDKRASERETPHSINAGAHRVHIVHIITKHKSRFAKKNNKIN